MTDDEREDRCPSCRGTGACAQCPHNKIGGSPTVNLDCQCLGSGTCVDCSGQGSYRQYAIVRTWRLKQVLRQKWTANR